MHEAAGNQKFISQSILHIKEQLARPTPELAQAISNGIGSNEAAAIESKRVQLLAHANEIALKAQAEPSHKDYHYVSRFDGVGLFQSALSKIFAEVPNLQGYGDWNPIWVITEIEVFAHKVKTLLADIHEDVSGKKQPVWAAIISEMLRLRTFDDRASYPTGVPEVVQLPDSLKMVLIADWGGDNDAAKKIASDSLTASEPPSLLPASEEELGAFGSSEYSLATFQPWLCWCGSKCTAQRVSEKSNESVLSFGQYLDGARHSTSSQPPQDKYISEWRSNPRLPTTLTGLCDASSKKESLDASTQHVHPVVQNRF